MNESIRLDPFDSYEEEYSGTPCCPQQEDGYFWCYETYDQYEAEEQWWDDPTWRPDEDDYYEICEYIQGEIWNVANGGKCEEHNGFF